MEEEPDKVPREDRRRDEQGADHNAQAEAGRHIDRDDSQRDGERVGGKLVGLASVDDEVRGGGEDGDADEMRRQRQKHIARRPPLVRTNSGPTTNGPAPHPIAIGTPSHASRPIVLRYSARKSCHWPFRASSAAMDQKLCPMAVAMMPIGATASRNMRAYQPASCREKNATIMSVFTEKQRAFIRDVAVETPACCR